MLASAADAPPPPERLARAKQERLNSFVFNFATLPSQLQRAAAYELLGVPQVRLDRCSEPHAGVNRFNSCLAPAVCVQRPCSCSAQRRTSCWACCRCVPVARCA